MAGNGQSKIFCYFKFPIKKPFLPFFSKKLIIWWQKKLIGRQTDVKKLIFSIIAEKGMENILEQFRSAWIKFCQLSLVVRIIIGLCIGIVLALVCPQATAVAYLGKMFVGALKGLAPILVFVLVAASLAQHNGEMKNNVGKVVCLYVIGMLLAGGVSVGFDYLFHPTLILGSYDKNIVPPQDVSQVLGHMLVTLVDNPVKSIAEANYLGILFWAILMGLALRVASESTKKTISEISEALSKVIGYVIECAPFGVMGLVFSAIAESGLGALLVYGRLILVLVGAMAVVALVTNPLIVWFKLRRNPYPLVWKCLCQSGIPAFFTRSSAANIPVNMGICEELKLDEATYSVSIPLGAIINMSGAACTIAILTLAAANTLGLQVGVVTALMLCVIATISACGTSGVAGGSLLLIPLACNLFGIPVDVAMQVVGVGFVIGVIQDSCETALNSSTDVLFTVAVELAEKKEVAV